MAQRSDVYLRGPDERTVRTADGTVVPVPAAWILLPPGDPALTRRVKAAGPHWVVQEKRGRKIFSLGVWADGQQIAKLRDALVEERSRPAYARQLAQGAQRRERQQAAYVEDFRGAIVTFLDFDSRFAELAEQLATAVADHATPVGSGTVARTKRIPIEARAEAAVIAWMRHQTTAYDRMQIPRAKGARREVRQLLARRSHELLASYRRGLAQPAQCPLAKALSLASDDSTEH